MSEKKLGRGLDFLIKKTTEPPTSPSTSSDSEESTTKLPINQIEPNPHQPRRTFDPAALEDLTSSILEHGVLQPIAVRRRGDRYEIVSGERRWRACRELGEKDIPVVVVEADDRKMLELALVENIQRQDLDAIEKARGYHELMESFGLTQEEVATRVSQKRSTVANFLRLLDLPQDLQSLVQSGLLTMGHGRALLAFDDGNEQRRLAKEAARGRLTVRRIEELARRQTENDEITPRPGRRRPPQLQAIEDRLRDRFGTKVTVTGSLDKGKVTIDFFDADGLQRVIDVCEGQSVS